MSGVVGTKELITRLQTLRIKAAGVVAEPALQNLMVSRVVGRFDQGVDPNGSPWPGLMASTLKRKRSKGSAYANKPLQDTRRLRNSIGVLGITTGLIGSATGLGFRIGVRDAKAAKYGRLHNEGIGGQEKRQFIGIGATDVRSVRDYINRRLKSIAKGD